jgi:predicted phage replisome organizer
MADVKWIKIVTDIFDDEKVLLIEQLPEADSIIVIWFKLLCLAGKQNNRGVFLINESMPYTDEMFSAVFRRNINTVRLALSTFAKFGMVEIIGETVTIPNWGKHQNIEGMEKRQEYMREYMKNYREEQKLLASSKHLHKRLCKQNVNDADIDLDIDKDKEVILDKPIKKFIPPGVDEVKMYCQERKNGINPAQFVDFYTARGWMTGKNKMKDWKAAVRTWEVNGINGGKKVSFQNYDQGEEQVYTGPDLLKEAREARG